MAQSPEEQESRDAALNLRAIRELWGKSVWAHWWGLCSLVWSSSVLQVILAVSWCRFAYLGISDRVGSFSICRRSDSRYLCFCLRFLVSWEEAPGVCKLLQNPICQGCLAPRLPSPARPKPWLGGEVDTTCSPARCLLCCIMASGWGSMSSSCFSEASPGLRCCRGTAWGEGTHDLSHLFAESTGINQISHFMTMTLSPSWSTGDSSSSRTCPMAAKKSTLLCQTS